MKGAFVLDSKLYKIVDKAVSLIKLTVLWLLFSLPVVTIGAAGCALYDTAVGIAGDREGYICRNFLRVFSQKAKQASKLWLILLPAGAGLLFNLAFWTHQGGMFAEMMAGIVVVMLMCWFVLALYGFALVTKMEAPVRITLKNAAFLALRHLPQSLYMLLWTGIFLAAGWLWTPVMLAELFAGPAALAVICGKVMERILEAEIRE